VTNLRSNRMRRSDASATGTSPIGGLSDNELVAAVALRNEDALSEIYSRYGASVYFCALRLCGLEHGKGVTHRVFLDLWNTPSAFHTDRRSLHSELLAAAHTRAVYAWRDELNRSDDELTAQLRRRSRGSEALALNSNERVRVLLRRLSHPQRQAVLLAYFGGYSYRQIASRLGRSEASVTKSLRDAFRILHDDRSGK
jgi:RNA polymerase sigma factor (sigma-70 family)